MRDHEAEAIRRTRREVGWSMPPASPQDRERVLALMARAGGEAVMAMTPTTPEGIGEALNAATRFCACAFAPVYPVVDVMRLYTAADIVAGGFPVDTEFDVMYFLRMRGRERDVLDNDAFVHLLRSPSDLLRRMHPDYTARLLGHAVDAIAEASASGHGTPHGASPEWSFRQYRHAFSPSLLARRGRDGWTST